MNNSIFKYIFKLKWFYRLHRSPHGVFTRISDPSGEIVKLNLHRTEVRPGDTIYGTLDSRWENAVGQLSGTGVYCAFLVRTDSFVRLYAIQGQIMMKEEWSMGLIPMILLINQGELTPYLLIYYVPKVTEHYEYNLHTLQAT